MKKKKRTELIPDYSAPIKQRKPKKTEYRKRQDKIDKSVKEKYLSQTGLDELHAAQAMKKKIADIDAKADKTADRMAREILKPMNDEAKEERKLNRAAVAAMRKALKEQKREERIEARGDKKARDILKSMGISQSSSRGDFLGFVNETIIKSKPGTYENWLNLPKREWEEMVMQDIAENMQTSYASWYTQIADKYGERKAAKETTYIPADQRYAENKYTVSEETYAALKVEEYYLNKLHALPNVDEFINMTPDEQTRAYRSLKETKGYFEYVSSDEYKESQKKEKIDMEVARSRILNSPNVPEVIKSYIKSGDLQVVKDFVDFLADAKQRTSAQKNQYYWDNLLPAENQDDITDIAALAKKGTDEFKFLEFIAYRLKQPHVDDVLKARILYSATTVKKNGRYIFGRIDDTKQALSFKDLKGYR